MVCKLAWGEIIAYPLIEKSKQKSLPKTNCYANSKNAGVIHQLLTRNQLERDALPKNKGYAPAYTPDPMRSQVLPCKSAQYSLVFVVA